MFFRKPTTDTITFLPQTLSSRQVHVSAAFVRLALQVLSLDKILNSLANVRWLSLEHLDHLDHILNQVVVLVLLPGLHDLHNLSVNYELALFGDLRHSIVASLNLVLLRLHWHKHQTDRLVLECLVDRELLVWILELGVLLLLQKKFDLGVDQVEESSLQLLVRNLSLILDLFICKLVIARLIVHVEKGCLEDIDDNLVGSLQILRVQLNLTVLVKPIDTTVGVLVAVEVIESNLEGAERARNLARNSGLDWPIAGGEDFGSEVDIAELVSWILALELSLHGLALLHIFEHGCHVIDNVETALDLELL